MVSLTLNDFATVIGLIAGITALVLGILNYLRDRAKIVVTLEWDMEIRNSPDHDSRKPWGIVSATNVGRRPIYIRQAGVYLPSGQCYIIFDSLQGKKLAEGDAPADFILAQSGFENHAKHWKKLQGYALDSRKKTWKSSRRKNKTKPSWAKYKDNQRRSS